MEDLRLSAVATRVVAWHNRHPLARRITAQQVHAIGYVALPFAQQGLARQEPELAPSPATPEGGTLREKAQARARQQAASGAPEGVPTVNQMAVDVKRLHADFSENFIDPLSPRQVARFAKRHGQALVRAPADGPLRQVRADGRAGGGLTLYLLTAVIETGTRKSRVLLGGGNEPAVLGSRVHTRARWAAAVAPLLLAGAGAAWWLRPAGPAPAVVAVAAPQAAASAAPATAAASSAAPGPAGLAAASAPSLAASAVATAPATAPASAPASATASATTSTPASAAAPSGAAGPLVVATAAPVPDGAASAPLDVEPHLGRIEMPSIRPHLDRDLKGAAAAERAGSAPTRSAAAGPRPQAGAAAAPPPPPAPPAVSAFALSTRPLRTRAEADQVRVAMKSLLRAMAANEVRVDVLPEGDDWRVVGMPFASRGDADKARALLVSRGMRVEVVGF